jgi:hypothetical protein
VELPGITGDAVNDALADLHRCSRHQHYALAGHEFRLAIPGSLLPKLPGGRGISNWAINTG